MSTDPFAGAWTLNLTKSSFTVPAPRSWVQQIQCSAEGLSLAEQITTADGSQMNISLRAFFDGKDYPVSGSRFVDSIVYARPDAHTISAIGRQNGAVSMRHSSALSADGDSYTMSLSLFSGGRQIASANLVFEKFSQKQDGADSSAPSCTALILSLWTLRLCVKLLSLVSASQPQHRHQFLHARR
jgi:hypothetical protein